MERRLFREPALFAAAHSNIMPAAEVDFEAKSNDYSRDLVISPVF
jgi:hypothetical protein